MKTSSLKKLTLAVVIASAFTITGCRDANSSTATDHPAEVVNTNPDAATTSVANTKASEEAKRNAEAGYAIY